MSNVNSKKELELERQRRSKKLKTLDNLIEKGAKKLKQTQQQLKESEKKRKKKKEKIEALTTSNIDEQELQKMEKKLEKQRQKNRKIQDEIDEEVQAMAKDLKNTTKELIESRQKFNGIIDGLLNTTEAEKKYKSWLKKVLNSHTDLQVIMQKLIGYLGEEISIAAEERGLKKGNQIYFPKSTRDGETTYTVFNKKGTRIFCTECTEDEARKQLGAIINVYRSR